MKMGGLRGDLNVMIADDDELIRKVITIYFNGRGYRVIAVANGQECLAHVRLSEPDALLLDVTMPGMDGWEVCRRIREFSAMPIIMLTARAQESDREMGAVAGASAYVTKPVSLRDLEITVRTLVTESGSTKETGDLGIAA
jgi:DNA-binding response OmpR family regulator